MVIIIQRLLYVVTTCNRLAVISKMFILFVFLRGFNSPDCNKYETYSPEGTYS